MKNQQGQQVLILKLILIIMYHFLEMFCLLIVSYHDQEKTYIICKKITLMWMVGVIPYNGIYSGLCGILSPSTSCDYLLFL